ncbi:hypothetical protein A7U60_g7674 [Sanghuangporus baumii]|uniref:Uncharacterized protein n=1 Tax=Sanghuangporus baumii TaxID=108892 RepID=A0A9Q5MZV3_SANBA|nr:hypothetical protein A7U60_g7674 [Sanghuangporus baumii]
MGRGHGYEQPTYRRGATMNLKTTEVMDRALRAGILSNAQRRYEAAARELWIRTQAEAQAQVKALARPRDEGRAYERGYSHSRPHRQEWPLPQNCSSIHSQSHVQAGPSRSPNYLSPEPVARTPSYAPSPSPNTPTPILYCFRQVPDKPSAKPDPSRICTEDDLQVEELKRRYYAQLSNSGYSQTRLYGEPPRSRSAMNYNMRMQHAYGSSSTPVRTTADEYLDYYMPARRGPQSSHSYQRHRDIAHKYAEERAAEERYRHQVVERRAQTYNSEVGRRNEVRSLPIERSHDDQSSRISRMNKERGEQRQPSKGNLTFLLNPSEPDDPKASPRHKDLDRRAKTQELEPRRPSMHERRSSYEASTSRSGSERMNETLLERTQRNLQLPLSSRVTKRKHSSLPESPYHSEASDEDETSRVKRCAFGRLPAEHDDNRSELGSEEEERDEVNAAQLSSESNGRAASPGGEANQPRSEVRHNFARSAKGKCKDSESKVVDVSERQTTLTFSSDEGKKYYFRPRPKATSR